MLLGFIISSYVHFNSQPHEEADRRKEVWLYFYANFNSQPHEEADDIDEKNNVSQEDFNSQPHEEADDECKESKIAPYISTHSLTKRLTNTGVCTISGTGHFNSQPHEEADLGAITPFNNSI